MTPEGAGAAAVSREHQRLEWKESWRDDHLRWICGFANSEGGVLVVGRNDRGEIVGVADARRLLEELPNKTRDLLGIVVDVHLRSEAGREYLEIAVPAYPNPISLRGEYYYRSGSTNQALRGAALDRFLLRRQGRHWDGVPVPGYGVGDLSAAAITAFRKRAARGGRISAEQLAEPDGVLLDRLHLLDDAYLKRAALLLFHEDPERIATGAYVKIGRFRTHSDLLYQDTVHGDLFTQVDRALDLLLTKYLAAGITYEGLQRVETFPVPAAALREMLINAVAHKDYGSGIPIQIRVFDDRLSIWNAGQLPPEWTFERLTEPHSSMPYNPDVANAFFRASLVESWGRGIELIRDACRAHGSPPPEFRWDNGLWAELPFLASRNGVVTPEVTPEVTPGVTPEVALLRALRGEMSRRRLQEALGLRDAEHFRQRYLLVALEAGWIEMTHPDRPNSRLQKYRLTSAGSAVLAGTGKVESEG